VGWLADAEGARVAAVSSIGHLFGPVVFDDLHYRFRPYDQWTSYGQSKSAIVLFAVGAAQRWADDGIAVNALMPGNIASTALARHMGPDDLANFGKETDLTLPPTCLTLRQRYIRVVAASGIGRCHCLLRLRVERTCQRSNRRDHLGRRRCATEHRNCLAGVAADLAFPGRLRKYPLVAYVKQERHMRIEAAHKVDVLRRHCEAVARDSAEIQKTVMMLIDPLTDLDGFLADAERYGRLGFDLIDVVPPVDETDPVGFAGRLGDHVIPVVSEFEVGAAR